MTLDELREKYGNIEVKEGFEDFIVKPKTGKVYSINDIVENQLMHYVDEEGYIYRKNFDSYESYYHKVIKQGNAFYDKESAKEEVKRREVYHTVEKYAYKFSRDEWEKNLKNKYYPYYYYPAKTIEITFVNVGQRTGLHFKTEEDIQKAIDEVGEKDFIRYYLGVEL